jgi:RNA-binding protein
MDDAYNGAMPLSEKQKKYLRRLGHELEPIVMLGNAGLTDGVVKEMHGALEHHELLKARARIGDRSLRDQALATLAERTQSELVQRIGNVGLYYRGGKKIKKIVLPD